MSLAVQFDTIAEMFNNLAQKYKGKNKTVLAYKPGPNDPYKEVTWDAYYDDTMSLAAYYVEFGVKPGDRIAILSENRYEWAVMDMALQIVGAVNVSLYATLPPNQCSYIINDSGAKLFFVSTGIQLKKAVEIFDECKDLTEVVAFDTPQNERLLDHSFVRKFESVLAEGAKLVDKHLPEIKKRTKALKPADLCTLIYTSGTTGQPKGVMLTHDNICSNIKAAHMVLEIDDSDRTLSFLPLCHSFERTGGYYAILSGGGEIFYAESIDTVSKNLLEARPTIVVSVPRLFEKILNLVKKSVDEAGGTKKAIFNWATSVGDKYAKGQRGLVSIQHKIADKLVFSKLRERFGGRVNLFVSGGAALPAEVGLFFAAAGMRITEGYGLTETSPVMTVSPWGKERYGTVGHVVPGVTVAIQRVEDNAIIAELSGNDYPSTLTSEEGEILCKGPNVMQGYWGKKKETAEVIDKDGWFHTGDIGKFDKGYLMITDRLKHMLVNAGGKNIYPGPIEDMLKSSIWVDQVVVAGEHQNYMGALIVPDLEVAKSFCRQNNIKYKDDADLINVKEVVDAVEKDIKQFNKKLASHEKIRKFRLISEPFSIEGGELTPTLKIKRRVVYDKYQALLDDIFADDVK
ncbi:MAG: long-chain fatty acid--CoA ligase [Bacteroidetes bacterium]|nr:long-chain fatty acid--CoA ligase [Bacteroidota bacterium]MCH8523795.1 long-chain fatty acid--CoA ligase [Balneolales bacterium]